MANKEHEVSGKRAGSSDKSPLPSHEGGDHIREAQQWSGGSKGVQGPDHA